MTFTLTINGESPAELQTILQQLNTAPQQPQSEAAVPPEKPKTPAPAKQKKPAQKPAATPAENQPEIPANPTVPASAPDEPQASTPAQTAPSEATATAPSAEPEKDPATIQKLLALARPLSIHGKRNEVKAIIAATGAPSISELPPASYTAVWEKLCALKDEVDADAAN